MDSWILILLSVGAVVINAVLKNKKDKQRRATGNQEPSSGEEEMSVPDIFSTLFDFAEPKRNDREETSATESIPLNISVQPETIVQTETHNIEDEVIIEKPKERIDPRKMIIYSELLRPKYKEV